MNYLQNQFNLVLVSAFLLGSVLLTMGCNGQPLPAEAPAPPDRVAFASVSPEPVRPADAPDSYQDRTELRRRLIKSYSVSANDALQINNQFGDVSVTLWDRNEMRVEVVVTATADEHDRAKQALDAVGINTTVSEENDPKRTLYIFRTDIADDFANGRKTNRRSNVLRVDYRISMPKANALTIHNKFGNTTLPNFSAPLTVNSEFGNVYGSMLSNPDTQIKASFGNVVLRDVQNGKVQMSFGDLDINSGNVLSIVQEYGKLRIGETNKVNAQVSYADAVIGAIRQSGTINASYTKQLRLDQLPASADKLDVVANFSTVALPVQPQTNCDFNITVTNGGFTYPTLPNLHLTQPAANAPRTGKAKQYVGRVGSGDGPRIRVVSVFGDVKLK